MKTICLFISLLMIVSCTRNTDVNKILTTIDHKGTDGTENIKRDDVVSVFFSPQPKLIITVGGDKADVRGYTSQAIQIAVAAIRQSGGGTVKILPGQYEITGPIKLYSNITLTGSGTSTILKKSKVVRKGLLVDPGYGEQHITVSDVTGFAPGMGIQICDSINSTNWNVSTAVITNIEGNILHLDNCLARDYMADKGAVVSNACSLISAVDAENVTISNLTVDGNREQNDALNGCRGGGIYLHKVNKALIENVFVKNFNKDGISWQITEDVTVRNCEVSGCANAGLHPGTGSMNTLIEGTKSHDNDHYGIYVCWRVRFGSVRNNSFSHNGGDGVSTGHMDTDMLYENNQISDNARDGVSFRNETKANAPHRSVFKNNVVENNGWRSGGYGFTFNSPAEGVILKDNVIRNTKGLFQKAAIHIMKDGLPVLLINNKISEHPNGEVVTD